MVVFHSYVKLPEGILCGFLKQIQGKKMTHPQYYDKWMVLKTIAHGRFVVEFTTIDFQTWNVSDCTCSTRLPFHVQITSSRLKVPLIFWWNPFCTWRHYQFRPAENPWTLMTESIILAVAGRGGKELGGIWWQTFLLQPLGWRLFANIWST